MKPFLALDNAVINKFKSLSEDLPKKETSRSCKKKLFHEIKLKETPFGACYLC